MLVFQIVALYVRDVNHYEVILHFGPFRVNLFTPIQAPSNLRYLKTLHSFTPVYFNGRQLWHTKHFKGIVSCEVADSQKHEITPSVVL